MLSSPNGIATVPSSSQSRASPLLLGRAREAEQLGALLRAGPAVLVTGPFGIGKTSLVAAVVDREAREGGIPRPAWASLAGAGDEAAILERVASALGLLGEIAAAPMQAGGALAALLREDPRTLVLDDCHATVHEALLRVLEALLGSGAALGASRLAVIASDDGECAALPGRLEALSVPCFRVPGLDPAASVQLLQALEHERGLTVYDALAALAGGNPLALQLALVAVSAGEADPARRARQTLAALAPPARPLLTLLVAAGIPIPLTLLDPEMVRDAVPSLVRHGLARIDEGRVVASFGTAQAFAHLLAEASGPDVQVLADLGERLLAAAPGEPGALRFACRALVRGGGACRAIPLLQRHALARARLTPPALAALLREIAAADPRCAPECQLLLAEEELAGCDFAAAARTLAAIPAHGLPPDLEVRIPALRARALVRAGHAAAAAEALRQARERAPLELCEDAELAAVELALLRGDAPEARRMLRELRRAGPPRPDAPRAVLLGVSYLLEGRLRRAQALARRVRREFRRRGAAVEPLLHVAEVMALVAQGQLEPAATLVAEALAEDAERGGRLAGVTALLQMLLAAAGGALPEARRHGERALRILERRSDRLLLAVGAHVLFRCALGQGALGRAEELLHLVRAMAAEPELGALALLADLQAALLHAARGEHAAGAERARRVARSGLQLPTLRVEAWAMSRAPGPCPPTGIPAGDAYAALRSAERALDEGDLAQAEAQATSAERWLAQAGAKHQLARAGLARAEALARAGRHEDARALLDDVASAARRGQYAPVTVGVELVRAWLAEQAGDRPGCAQALSSAVAAAGAELLDRTLAAAASRAGVSCPAPTTPGRPWSWSAAVERLGLARPVLARFELGGRCWLLAGGETWAAPVHLVVRLAQGDVWSAVAARALPAQGLQLLAFVARAGPAGTTLAELHRLRGGREYHPLRHRNAIYVALSRLRESLADLVPSREWLEVMEGRCRVAPAVQVGVLEAVPPSGAAPA